MTFNLRHFRPQSLEPFDMVALHPDQFLLDQYDLEPDTVQAAVWRMLRRNRRPPRDTAALAEYLARTGVPDFAAVVRTF